MALQLFAEPAILIRDAGIHCDVVQHFGELIPERGSPGAEVAGFLHLLVHVGAEGVIVHRRAADAHDRETRRKQSLLFQVKDRRDQFPPREISGCSEDHHQAGFGNLLQAEGFQKRMWFE